MNSSRMKIRLPALSYLLIQKLCIQENVSLMIYTIFVENASSSEGYKHTDEAKQKMVKILEDKSNYPF